MNISLDLEKISAHLRGNLPSRYYLALYFLLLLQNELDIIR